MEAFGLYLVKTSILLLVFWGIYRLFLHKETTFRENRYFLLSGIFVAVLLPFLKIKQTVMVSLTPMDPLELPGPISMPEGTQSALNLPIILFGAYLLGCLFFTVKLALQLYAIQKLAQDARTWKEGDLVHVETEKSIAPFSFFRALFYHPKQFESPQLEAILLHEKVHARQWHSIDVLLSEGLKILLWCNPMVWWYQRALRQNLEFLADAHAVDHCDRTSYQYLMVRQALGHPMAITNSFYNSLIKKRIVMLNKNRSKQWNALKSFLVLPLIALFLLAFGTEKVVEYSSNSPSVLRLDATSFKLIIHKATSDEELMKMKADLNKEGVDFSYTTVRNEEGNIIDISVQISGEGKNGAQFKNSHASSNTKNGISPLVVIVDLNTNSISIGTEGTRVANNTGAPHGKHKVWISSKDSLHERIWISEENGEKKVVINGVEIHADGVHEDGMNIFIEEGEDGEGHGYRFGTATDGDHESQKHITIKKHRSENGASVMILKDTDQDTDVDVLGPHGFFFTDTDGREPLYVIDGKQVTKKDVQQLSPKEIRSIDVSKGKAATKKYGKKAKDGVVEITTKTKE